MADQHDVTVRIPVEFESAMEAAGFIERAVVNAMEAKGWTGGAAVITHADDGVLRMFVDGKGLSEYPDFRSPHGLLEMGGYDPDKELKGTMKFWLAPFLDLPEEDFEQAFERAWKAESMGLRLDFLRELRRRRRKIAAEFA